MNQSAFFQLPIYVVSVIIFCLIILFTWLGYHFKKGQIRKYPGQVQEKMGSIEGSILSVMSLLLAFTFSVAMSKFEAQRQLAVQETNYITTAILLCDMYPDTIRVALRGDFKEYLETRIAYYSGRYDEHAISKAISKSKEVSGRIWKNIADHSNDPEFRVRSQQMIPIIHDIIDMVTTRDAMRISRVPAIILHTLVILILIAAFLLGTDFNGHKRNIILLMAYALVMTLTLNLINELNHPRQGFINLNEMQHKLEDLRELLQ